MPSFHNTVEIQVGFQYVVLTHKKVAKSLIDDFEVAQNKEAEYVVEKLVDRKRVKNGVSYLVKWENYGMDDCTWEDGTALPADMIKKYEQQYG